MTDIGHSSGEQYDPDSMVRRIKDGDVAAEADLVRHFSRSLMTMLRRRLGDEQRAEDIHQDTFCVVLERLRGKSIEDPSRLAAFVHRTAINLSIGEYRKEVRRKTHADSDLIQRVKGEEPDHLQRLIRKESGNAVREIVLELQNTRDRELLYRFYILQEDKPVVCKVLDLTPDHFDRVIYRARQRFRNIVEKRRLVLADAEGMG